MGLASLGPPYYVGYVKPVVFTPKGLYLEAQGRASHPGKTSVGRIYPEGALDRQAVQSITPSG